MWFHLHKLKNRQNWFEISKSRGGWLWSSSNVNGAFACLAVFPILTWILTTWGYSTGNNSLATHLWLVHFMDMCYLLFKRGNCVLSNVKLESTRTLKFDSWSWQYVSWKPLTYPFDQILICDSKQVLFTVTSIWYSKRHKGLCHK